MGISSILVRNAIEHWTISEKQILSQAANLEARYISDQLVYASLSNKDFTTTEFVANLQNVTQHNVTVDPLSWGPYQVQRITSYTPATGDSIVRWITLAHSEKSLPTIGLKASSSTFTFSGSGYDEGIYSIPSVSDALRIGLPERSSGLEKVRLRPPYIDSLKVGAWAKNLVTHAVNTLSNNFDQEKYFSAASIIQKVEGHLTIDTLSPFNLLIVNGSVTLNNNSVVNNCAIIADEILVGTGFTGHVQLYATQKLEIGTDVKLLNGSLLATSSAASQLIIPSNTQIEGSIICLGSNNNIGFFMKEKSVVKGLIYCNSSSILEGTISGSILTDKIASYTNNEIKLNLQKNGSFLIKQNGINYRFDSNTRINKTIINDLKIVI